MWVQVEQEEEFLTNTLQKKLDKVGGVEGSRSLFLLLHSRWPRQAGRLPTQSRTSKELLAVQPC